MKRRIGWVEMEGKRVFRLDFKGLEGEVLSEHVLYSCIEAEKVNEKSLFLIDLRDTKLTFELMNHMADVSKKIQPHVERSTILLSNNYVKTLFILYARITKSKAKTFSEMKDAKKYILG